MREHDWKSLGICISRPTYLHLNVKNAYPTLLCNVPNRFEACTIVVAPKLSVLDEALLLNQVLEFFLSGEVIFATVLLAGPRLSCSV